MKLIEVLLFLWVLFALLDMDPHRSTTLFLTTQHVPSSSLKGGDGFYTVLRVRYIFYRLTFANTWSVTSILNVNLHYPWGKLHVALWFERLVANANVESME